MVVYSKAAADGHDVVLVVVNLDPHNTHEDTLWLDLDALGVDEGQSFEVHDELSDATYVWSGNTAYVRLPPEEPAHLLHVRSR